MSDDKATVVVDTNPWQEVADEFGVATPEGVVLDIMAQIRKDLEPVIEETVQVISDAAQTLREAQNVIQQHQSLKKEMDGSVEALKSTDDFKWILGQIDYAFALSKESYAARAQMKVLYAAKKKAIDVTCDVYRTAIAALDSQFEGGLDGAYSFVRANSESFTKDPEGVLKKNKSK